METIALNGPRLGLGELCDALAVPRATYYRRLTQPTVTARSNPPRALTSGERQHVLDGDMCSKRTMYRILTANAEVKERRNQLRHPEYKKPELLANGAQPARQRQYRRAS